MRWLPLLLTLALSSIIFIGAPANALDTRTIPIPVTYLVSDPDRGLLYGSVRGTHATHGNSVVAIEPVSGEVVASVFVGSEPGRIVISGDGEDVYVHITSTGKLRRVHLDDFTAGPTIDPGSDSGGLYRFGDFAASPRQGRSVLATLHQHFEKGVAIIEGDQAIVREVNPSLAVATIIPTLTPHLFFGGTFGIRPIVVDAGGLRTLPPYFLDEAFFHASTTVGGRTYTNIGRIYDATGPGLVGAFQGTSYDSVFCIDPALQCAFYTQSFPEPVVQVYDIHTFALIQQIPIEIDGVELVSIARWGPTGLALATQSDGLLLIEPTLNPPLRPRPMLSVISQVNPLPAALLSASELTVTVSNSHDTAPSHDTIVYIDPPPNCRFGLPQSSQGNITQFDRTIVVRLGTIGANSSATVTCPLTPELAGDLRGQVAVTGPALDDDATNDFTEIVMPSISVPGPDLVAEWNGPVNEKSTGRGYTFRGSFTVSNIGTISAKKSKATIVLRDKYDLTQSPIPVAVLKVPSVKPGRSVKLKLPRKPAVAPPFPLEDYWLIAVVDSDARIAELAELNNESAYEFPRQGP